MERFIFVALFLITFLVSAQNYDTNRFSDTENKGQNLEVPQTLDEGEQVGNGPGNPGGDDDLPIDDYLPVLAITAIGIIIYKTRKKRNLLS